MIKTIKQSLTYGSVGWLLGAGVAMWAARDIPPLMTVHSAVMMSTVVSGEWADIRMDVTWTEDCDSYVDAFIMLENGDVIWRHPNRPMAHSSEGHHVWTARVMIPGFLSSGDYKYRMRISAKCPSGNEIEAIPDLDFKIDRNHD